MRVDRVDAGTLRDLDIYCPQCFYNVRGVAGERCPECGLLIDREEWASSPIPWEHRRKLGWMLAYVRTVRVVTSRAKRFAVATPQGLSARDAWRFWVITSLPPALLLMLAVALRGGPATVAGPLVSTALHASKDPMWWMDLLGPWEAGMLVPGVAPLAVLGSLVATILGMSLVCRWSASNNDRGRVWAMALYSCAPLGYWTLTLLCGWVLMRLATKAFALMSPVPEMLVLLVIVPLPWWVWRMTWTAHVVGKCSFLRAGFVTVGWLAGILVGFGVLIPWVIGLVRLMAAP